MAQNGPETDALLERAGQGDELARQRLLDRHRSRLVRMIAVRMDVARSSGWIRPTSFRKALADAARELPHHLLARPMAFYPWLRQLAWERLLLLQRHHIEARRRSVDRERSQPMCLPDESALALADCLFAEGTSPSGRLMREELRQWVRDTLDQMSPRDREVLVLRYLEMLSNKEIADVLGITEGAVKVRHLRALERLRSRLDDNDAEGLR